MTQPMRTSSLHSNNSKSKQDGTLVGDVDTNKNKSNNKIDLRNTDKKIDRDRIGITSIETNFLKESLAKANLDSTDAYRSFR